VPTGAGGLNVGSWSYGVRTARRRSQADGGSVIIAIVVPLLVFGFIIKYIWWIVGAGRDSHPAAALTLRLTHLGSC
jgi:hypothetical protein